MNNGFDISDPNDLNIKFINPKQAIETFSFLEIIPGFKAFNKNYLDYLSLAKVTQILPTFASSLKNSSTVTKSPFIPFAKIWARYFASFESKEIDYFGVIAKHFISARIKSSKSEFAFFNYFLISSFDIST